MKTGIKVGDIMTRNFISVKPIHNLSKCSREMVNHKVGSLIVKENQHFVGLITEKDILRALVKKKDLEKTTASNVMTKKPATIPPSKDIYQAMLKMKKSKARWLPVLVDGKVIGMVTLKDILKIQPTLLDIALEHWQIKEEEQKWKRIRGTGGEKWMREGACDECGAFDLLYKFRDMFVCENCKENLKY